MKLASLVLGVCASLLPLTAFAHPDEHDYDSKPLAAKCSDLGYPSRYETDAAYPQVKALIASCDVANKAAAKKAVATQKAAAHKATHQTAAQKAAAKKAAAKKAAALKAAQKA